MNTVETVKPTDTVQLKPPQSERRMLYSLAHPDDESFGPGGSIIRYAQAGIDLHLICATRGEVGTVDDKFMQSYDSIAEMRTDELLCAAQHLGLTAIHFLNYRDSGMPGAKDNHHARALHAADQNEAAARVATVIRQIKPQVVVTPDPIGGYRHPDHIAIHKATVQAYSMAGDPTYEDGNPPFQPSRLYYTTFPRGFMRLGVHLIRLFGANPRKFGRNKDVDLVSLSEVSFPIHYKIDVAPYDAAKQAAGNCHASQQEGGPGGNFLVSLLFKWLSRKESYMQARPPVPDDYSGADLWAGV